MDYYEQELNGTTDVSSRVLLSAFSIFYLIFIIAASCVTINDELIRLELIAGA